MSGKSSSQSKKIVMRRLVPSSKLTAEELTRRILLVCVEHLIPFESVDSPYFKALLNHNESSFIPDTETLVHLANEVYNEYQEYFKQYFEKKLDKNIKVSVSLHQWKPQEEINPYIFASYHFINDRLKFCELPLGFFNVTDVNFTNYLVNNQNLKDRLLFVTANYQLEENHIELLNYLMNSTEDIKRTNISMCLSKSIADLLHDFFKGIAIALNLENAESSFEASHDNEAVVSNIVYNFLGPIYRKLVKIDLKELLPLTEDGMSSNEFMDFSLKHRKSHTMEYLANLLSHRSKIEKLLQDVVSESDWQIATFAYEIGFSFQEVNSICSSLNSPVSHMLSKWLKMLILQVSSLSKKKSKLVGFDIKANLGKLLQDLIGIHKQMENNFSLILSAYLHPSTKRFLKDVEINKINSYVASLSNNESKSSRTSDSIDDMIMQMFDCSGKATKECYTYESSSISEMRYYKNTSYVSREVGLSILSFWRSNDQKYPVLSKLARNVLAIPLSTNRSFEFFKNSFPQMTCTNAANESTPLYQIIYFLHRLSKTYDLQSFYVKNSDLDIEDYRICPPEYAGYENDSNTSCDFPNEYFGDDHKRAKTSA